LSRADTDLDTLLRAKYQASVGVRYQLGNSVVSFAITENVANFNNTSDVGVQVGWTYSPAMGAIHDRGGSRDAP